MRLRSNQLACILLLLSTCHLAGATVLPARDFGVHGRYISLLLGRDGAGKDHAGAHLGAGDEWTPVGGKVSDSQRMDLTAGARVAYRAAWTMKAPAAQCTAIYSNTGSEEQNGCSLDATAPVDVRLKLDSTGSQSAS